MQTSPTTEALRLRQPQTESAKAGKHLHLTETNDVCLTAKPQLKRHSRWQPVRMIITVYGCAKLHIFKVN